MKALVFDNHLKSDEEIAVEGIPILNEEERIQKWVKDNFDKAIRAYYTNNKEIEVWMSSTPLTLMLACMLVVEGIPCFVIMRKLTAKIKGISNKKKYARDKDITLILLG